MDTDDRLTQADPDRSALERYQLDAIRRAHHRDGIAMGENVEFHKWMLRLLGPGPTDDEVAQDLGIPVQHVLEARRRVVRQLRRDAAHYRRRQRLPPRRPYRPTIGPRRGARARGAGRPRAAAARSSARSGDSGDEGPAELAPALAPAPPSKSNYPRCPECGSVQLLSGGREICAVRSCSRWGRPS